MGERVRLLDEDKDALTLPDSLGLPLGEEDMEKEGVRDSAGDMDALPLIDVVAHWVAGEEEEEREGEEEGETVRQVVPLELREEERVRELVTVPVLEREVDMVEEVQGVGEWEGLTEGDTLPLLDPDTDIDTEGVAEGEGEREGEKLGEVDPLADRVSVKVARELWRKSESTVAEIDGVTVAFRAEAVRAAVSVLDREPVLEPLREVDGVGDTEALLEPLGVVVALRLGERVVQGLVDRDALLVLETLPLTEAVGEGEPEVEAETLAL